MRRAAADEYLAVLDALAARGLDRNVSVKLSQMGLGVDPAACRENVERILGRAADHEAFVRIDMEDHATTDATLALWRELRPVNAGRGDSGVVIQAALRRSPADVDALIAEGARIRLCKGAYVEPASVAYPDKASVDEAYATLMERLLTDGTFPGLATHDERLIARAVAFVRDQGIPPDRFEFQMLFGVRRDLQERLVKAGFGVRVYVPFGTQWYPYFMRRLAERPANVAFVLRSVLREGRSKPSGLSWPTGHPVRRRVAITDQARSTGWTKRPATTLLTVRNRAGRSAGPPNGPIVRWSRLARAFRRSPGPLGGPDGPRLGPATTWRGNRRAARGGRAARRLRRGAWRSEARRMSPKSRDGVGSVLPALPGFEHECRAGER